MVSTLLAIMKIVIKVKSTEMGIFKNPHNERLFIQSKFMIICFNDVKYFV